MSTNNSNGSESSAVRVLTRAVCYDNENKYPEALVCYQEGIELLMDVLQDSDEEKRQKLRVRIGEYMNRAELVKVQVDKEKELGKYHEVIQIEEDDVGFDYERLFRRLLGKDVIQVVVEDPYIMSTHQVYNFLRFCELLVKCCHNLKNISLTTCMDTKTHDDGVQQKNKLAKIGNSLNSQGITLNIGYSTNLHDREIRFNNGWIIKIGRGLDIYKPPKNNFSIGFCDLSLRSCHRTTINIFHKKHTAGL